MDDTELPRGMLQTAFLVALLAVAAALMVCYEEDDSMSQVTAHAAKAMEMP